LAYRFHIMAPHRLPSFKRRRRAFDKERRQEVAAVRKIGACDRCREKKVKVRYNHSLDSKIVDANMKSVLMR
jgi:hypothetical protein